MHLNYSRLHSLVCDLVDPSYVSCHSDVGDRAVPFVSIDHGPVSVFVSPRDGELPIEHRIEVTLSSDDPTSLDLELMISDFVPAVMFADILQAVFVHARSLRPDREPNALPLAPSAPSTEPSPKPWKAEGNRLYADNEDGSNRFQAHFYYQCRCSEAEMLANVRLARSAPDFLAALEKEELADEMCEAGQFEAANESRDRARALRDDALARYRGEAAE